MILDKYVVSLLEQYWNISGVLCLKRIESSVNISILVETINAKYLLKGLAINKAEVYRLLLLWKCLLEHNIPVISPIMSFRAHPYVWHEDHYWILRRYVSGAVFTMNSPTEIIEAAENLTNIHNITVDGIDFCYNSIHDPYHWLYDMEKEIYFMKTEHADISGIEILIKKVKKICNDIRLDDYLQLPTCIVHGDYHGKNLIYSNSKMKAILDLETIGVSARILDIVEAVFFLGRYGYGEYLFNSKQIIDFLRAYCSNISITDKKIELAIKILKLRLIPRADYLRRMKEKSKSAAENQVLWAVNMMKCIDQKFEPLFISSLE